MRAIWAANDAATGGAQLLGKSIEAGFPENLLETIIKSVPTRPRNLIPSQIHRPLLITLTASPKIREYRSVSLMVTLRGSP